MTFRIHYRAIPGIPHVYCALYAADSPNQTFAMCGTFTVRSGREFEDLQRACSGVAFIEDDLAHGV